MRSLFLVIFFIGMCAFSAAGLSYFGPPEMRVSLQKKFPLLSTLSNKLNRYFMLGNNENIALSGEVSQIDGFFNFRSFSEFVSIPGTGTEIFYGKTLISVEKNSEMLIKLPDGSSAKFSENTMLILYPPGPGGSIQMKLLTGAVDLERANGSTTPITIITPNGNTKSLQNKLAFQFQDHDNRRDIEKIILSIKTKEIESVEVAQKIITKTDLKKIIKRSPATRQAAVTIEDKCDCDTCLEPLNGNCAIGSKNWYDFNCN